MVEEVVDDRVHSLSVVEGCFPSLDILRVLEYLKGSGRGMAGFVSVLVQSRGVWWGGWFAACSSIGELTTQTGSVITVLEGDVVEFAIVQFSFEDHRQPKPTTKLLELTHH